MNATNSLLFAIALPFLIQSVAYGAEEIDFQRDIAPILEERCWSCHGEDEQESGLRLDRRASMLRGGDYGLPSVVPGKPEEELSDRSGESS